MGKTVSVSITKLDDVISKQKTSVQTYVDNLFGSIEALDGDLTLIQGETRNELQQINDSYRNVQTSMQNLLTNTEALLVKSKETFTDTDDGLSNNMKNSGGN